MYQAQYSDPSRIKNPFFMTGSKPTVTAGVVTAGQSTMPAQMINALNTGVTFHVVTAVPLVSHAPSPYLIFPGDKLVLGISKTRPFFYNGTLNPTSGSIVHDVSLITGSVNITFYGSLVQNGSEFHDTLNQQFSTNAVHEIIGAEPILDQFEIAYRDEYISGSYDDYITGSLVTVQSVNGIKTLVTGSRGRMFSKFNVNVDGPPSGIAASSNDQHGDYTISYSNGLQPLFEKVGTSRVVKHVSQNERFWDSMMPNFSDCHKLDGASIVYRVLTPPFSTYAYAIFNGEAANGPNNPLPAIVNNVNWMLAYPFESRYSNVARQKNLATAFVASAYTLDIVNFSSTNQNSTWLGLNIQVGNYAASGLSGLTYLGGQIFSDSPLLGYYRPACSSDDALKVLYGFGDHNSIELDYTDPQNYFRIAGTNHSPESRYPQGAVGGGFWQCNVGPQIRGWKYGVYSGLPMFSSAYFRPGKFGQLRDMLEQRLFTKYYTDDSTANVTNQNAIGTSVVTVKFVDVFGKVTPPENTSSQNIDDEAASTVPYFDGVSRNRTPPNKSIQNHNIALLKSDTFNNTSVTFSK
jgi:hypothetical protein